METTEINKLPNTFQQTGTANKSDEKYFNEKSVQQHSEIPDRDRTIDAEQLTRDESTKVNFIPDSENDIYYIPTRQEIQQSVSSSSLQNKLSKITFEDLKMPILIMLLYIVFEFPTIRNFVKKTFSFSYDEQEQITFPGVVLMGLLFSASHFVMTNLIE
tara:strand:+ start:24793 stop:25269 length:477 start_codon:yes stop_codon:yes gene_type:complete